MHLKGEKKAPNVWEHVFQKRKTGGRFVFSVALVGTR